jgi:hypothetical protein
MFHTLIVVLFTCLFLGMKRNLLLVFVGLVVVFVGGLCLRYYLPDLK